MATSSPRYPSKERSQFYPNEAYEGSAVQLYKCQDGNYRLDNYVMNEVFGKVGDKLIAIYSISGKYRSGKSFLLNIFLKYLMFGKNEDWIDFRLSNPFKYKNCEQRVTAGIWIWSEPIMTRTKDGREVALLLMDTQGWHDDQTSIQDNALVFSLSVFLSSVVIFNAEKKIGEDDLHFLQCFSSHAKLLEKENNDEPFQKLMFLIRDWQFTGAEGFAYGYYDDHNSIEGKNFKTSRINPNNSQHIDAKSIREIITATYNNISAYLMPYPGSGVLSDHFDSKKTDPIFIKHAKDFTKIVFREVVPKQIGGKLMTGQHLMALAMKWDKEFKCDLNLNSGLSGSKNADDMPYFMAFQTALDCFDEKIKKELKKCNEIGDFQDLTMKLRNMCSHSEAVYHANRKLTNENIKHKYEERLRKELKEREKIYTENIYRRLELKEKEMEMEKQMNRMANISKENSEEMKEMNQTILKLSEQMIANQKTIADSMSRHQDDRREHRRNWLKDVLGFIQPIVGLVREVKDIFKSFKKEK